MKKNSSSASLIERAFKLSISNIWRNKFLSLATVFVIGTTIFIFNVILAINFIAQDALSDLSKKIDVVVYLKETTTFTDAQNLQNEILKLDGVENVSYTSKEDALNQIKTTHPNISLAFEKYQLGNPLPASLNITTINPQYHSSIAQVLAQDQYQIFLSSIVTNNSSTNNAIITSVSENLLKVSDFTYQIIFWLIVVFIIGGALIILNAIQITIFSRKKEINVMKLVGASYWFIRLPFIIESIIYGVLAVILGFLMLTLLSKNIALFEIDFTLIFIAELIATVLLSILSAMLAVHEHLHKKLLED